MPAALWPVGTEATISFPQLYTYLAKYQNPREADSMTKIQEELDETKIILVRILSVEKVSFHVIVAYKNSSSSYKNFTMYFCMHQYILYLPTRDVCDLVSVQPLILCTSHQCWPLVLILF